MPGQRHEGPEPAPPAVHRLPGCRARVLSGVNVIVGTNGTGKSHAMKAAYATLKAMEADPRPHQQPLRAVGVELVDFVSTQQLRGVFKPDLGDARRLLRRGAPDDVSAAIAVAVAGLRTRIEIRPNGTMEVDASSMPDAKALFLPSRELLSMFEGFLRTLRRLSRAPAPAVRPGTATVRELVQMAIAFDTFQPLRPPSPAP